MGTEMNVVKDEIFTGPVLKLMNDVLAFVNKLKKNGKEAILRFSKWTLTEEMVANTAYGEMSFKEYITESFKRSTE